MKSAIVRMSAILGMLLAVALPLTPTHAQGVDPAIATVQGFYDTLLDSMKNGKALGAQGRYNKLRPVVEQSFDITTMIKYSVGPAWDTTGASDQKALSEAFARMTAAQYAGNFDSFDGEKFVVDPNVSVRGTDHYVSSKLVTKDQTVVFIYRVRQFGGSWKIIDVLLDGGISQLNVYRSDFAATVKAGGAQSLVKKINELADKALKQ